MSDLIVERQAAGLCASCGEKATTTIVLHGRRTLVCLRHYNHWQTPHISLEEAAEHIAQARREGAAEAIGDVADWINSEPPMPQSAYVELLRNQAKALRGDS